MLSDQAKPTGYASAPTGTGRPSARIGDRLRAALRVWLVLPAPLTAAAADDLTESATAIVDWPSLDIVYEEIQDSIAAQNDRLKSIDTKANVGLVAGTLLTAGVTALGRALVDAGQEIAVPRWQILGFDLNGSQVVDWVTIVSLGAYALVAIGAYMAYRPRSFKEAPDPQRLVSKYIYEEPALTKATITNVRAKNYAINETLIERKAWWTNFAMIFLVLEALLLFTIALIQVAWL